MIHGTHGAPRDADILDQLLDMRRWWRRHARHDEGHHKVQHRTNGTEALRRDPEPGLICSTCAVNP